MLNKRAVWILGIFLFAQCVWAQAPRGFIPRQYINRPATDLFFQGKVLLPEEAHDLVVKSRGHFDLSEIDPVLDTNIWSPSFLNFSKEESFILPINEMDEVTYDSPVASQTTNFRFNVVKENEFGLPVIYTALISKKSHGYLMNRALLRKIGYNVPFMKHLKKLKIQFENEREKKMFITYFEQEAMAGTASDTILEDFGTSIIVQDLVVMESFSEIYNLAMGPVTADLIQGRRLFSGLSIPLSLTNFSESVNMMRWHAGTIQNNAIALNLENAEDFQTSWEDARWILKKIAKLNRQDFDDIASESSTPGPVKMLLAEKIISRRNNLMKIFKIEAPAIKVNEKVSNGVELVDGKLTQERWTGYSSRFAYGDPESPLSATDISSWIKSKAIQVAIDAAVSAVNWKLTATNWVFGQDVSDLAQDEVKSFFEKQKDSIIQNGPGYHLPVASWVYPVVNGNLILTRNITTGTYMGTDNLVNLVDVIGFQMSLGIGASALMFKGGMKDGGKNAEGQTILVPPTPINASLGADVSYARTWAHLRPVTSLKKALKYPFKNILVPMLKREYGKRLNNLVNLDFDQMTPAEREEKVKEAVSKLLNDLEIGESIIVTDSLLFGVNGSMSYSYMNWLKVQLGMGAQQSVVGRFHIHRRTKDSIQIYRDFGNVRSIRVNVGLNAILPVANVMGKSSQGEARTKFYQISLDATDEKIVENLGALRLALMNSSLTKLEELQKPYILKHRFNEHQLKLGIFTWEYNQVRANTHLNITHPKGDERRFFRASFSRSTGMNYQDYVMNSLMEVVGNYTGFSLGSSQSSSNPGFTFYGKAQNRIMFYEGEKTDDNKSLKKPFMRLSRIWNGWSLSAKKAQKILDNIRTRYRFEFFEPSLLYDTNKMSLYNISVNYFVYDKGIQYLKSLDEKSIKKIFVQNQRQKNLRINWTKKSEDELFEGENLKEKVNNTGLDRFLRRIKKAKRAGEKGNLQRESQMMLRAFAVAEKKLNIDGLKLLFGGESNFYVTSRIDGYRLGDEDGDNSLYGHTFGEIGSREVAGPLQQVVGLTEILEGEFFIYWLMTRVI